MPANTGAEAEVPPMIEGLLIERVRNTCCSARAATASRTGKTEFRLRGAKDVAGKIRRREKGNVRSQTTFPCPGIETVCQEGLVKPETQEALSEVWIAQLLGPPPVDEMPMSAWASAADWIGTQPLTAVEPPWVQNRLLSILLAEFENFGIVVPNLFRDVGEGRTTVAAITGPTNKWRCRDSAMQRD